MTIDHDSISPLADDEPAWLSSLVALLYRKYSYSSVIPIGTIVTEIADWVQLASGKEAWVPRPNRESLERDLNQSIEAIGESLRNKIALPLAAFQDAFEKLKNSPKKTFGTDPSNRVTLEWTRVTASAKELIEALATDEAVGASWKDLVQVAQKNSIDGHNYNPCADIFFEQLRYRGHDENKVSRELVVMISNDFDMHELPKRKERVSFEDRLAKAKEFVERPVSKEPIVVWLGYRGFINQDFEVEHVSFYDARRAIPYAESGRVSFTHDEEIRRIIQHGHGFQGARHWKEGQPTVGMLVRVDLGDTVMAGAVKRAKAVVDAILNVTIHRSDGARPRLVEHHVIRSGHSINNVHYAQPKSTSLSNDIEGARITADALERQAPRIVSFIVDSEIPQFIMAALEAQTAADYPFSRDMALYDPSEADISSVTPHLDRVVGYIAAHAGMTFDKILELLRQQWPYLRWKSDLYSAAHICIEENFGHENLRHELIKELYSHKPKQPSLLFLADRSNEFLSLCSIEHERAWVEKMFSSISDHSIYSNLIAEYEKESIILKERWRRVRNALVHGNPASFAIVKSVRGYASFTSQLSLNIALESLVDGTDFRSTLGVWSEEYEVTREGQSVASYWRSRVRSGKWNSSS